MLIVLLYVDFLLRFLIQLLIHWDPLILVSYNLDTIITDTDVTSYCVHVHICGSVCTCMHTRALAVEMGLI